MPPTNQALVALAPHERPSQRGAPGNHLRADFVAHLIATSAKAPQTRPRRRAEPRDATAAYAVLGQWPTPAGGTVSRSL